MEGDSGRGKLLVSAVLEKSSPNSCKQTRSSSAIGRQESVSENSIRCAWCRVAFSTSKQIGSNEKSVLTGVDATSVLVSDISRVIQMLKQKNQERTLEVFANPETRGAGLKPNSPPRGKDFEKRGRSRGQKNCVRRLLRQEGESVDDLKWGTNENKIDRERQRAGASAQNEWQRGTEANAAFVQGTGIKFLIPPSSVWCCHWPGVATWRMVVGGDSDAGTNGVEEGRLGEPSLPMEWMLGMGRTYLLKNSSGRSPLTDEKMPCLLRFDWSRPIIAESGRGKGLGRSENKRPETGDLEIKLISRSHRK
ncbi:hypothetical protein TNCV_2855381 [Trichonephila clavipes]|nr:hypothetical protein TNCV_2855381 [Trichonephila clavipes]